MHESQEPFWEDLAARLARRGERATAAQVDPNDVLDPNELATLMHTELSQEERETYLRALEHSPHDGDVFADLLEYAETRTPQERTRDVEHKQGTPASKRRLSWLAVPLAAAAAIALAFTLFPLLKKKDEPTRFVANVWDDATLTRAFDHLKASDPDAFQDLHPILSKEQKQGGNGVYRGGIAVTSPRGAITKQPTLAWQSVKGVDDYQARVVSDDGQTVFSKVTHQTSLTPSADALPLAKGTHYVLRIEAEAGGVALKGGSPFHWIHDEEFENYKAGLRAIDTAVNDPGARALLAAHLAARYELWEQARAHLEVDEDVTTASNERGEFLNYLDRMHTQK